MGRDAKRMRGPERFIFAALRHGQGVEEIVAHLCLIGGLAETA